MQSSTNISDIVRSEYRGCGDGSMMDGFSVFIQGLLAVLAFSTLMCKFLVFLTFSPGSFVRFCIVFALLLIGMLGM